MTPIQQLAIELVGLTGQELNEENISKAVMTLKADLEHPPDVDREGVLEKIKALKELYDPQDKEMKVLEFMEHYLDLR